MKENEINKLSEVSKKLQEIDFPNIKHSLQFQSKAFAKMFETIHTVNLSPLYETIAKISTDLSIVHKTFENLFTVDISPLMAKTAESLFLYQAQSQHLNETLSKLVSSYVLSLEKIRGNLFLSSAFIEQLSIINEFQETFAVKLAESLYQSFEIDDEVEQLEKVREITEQAISEQPNNKSKLEVLIFIFTIIGVMVAGISAASGVGQFYLAYLQYEASQQDSIEEDKRYSQIMNMFGDIAKKLSESDENNEIYYIVERQVQVKVKPTFKAPTIVIIYPNQKVKLVKKNHKWIYIEYFDYIDGVPKTGWANKKYLVKMN